MSFLLSTGEGGLTDPLPDVDPHLGRPLDADPHPVGQTPLNADPLRQTPCMQTPLVGQTPLGRPPWMQTPPSWADTPPPIRQQAGGMHPTGMHTCRYYFPHGIDADIHV